MNERRVCNKLKAWLFFFFELILIAELAVYWYAIIGAYFIVFAMIAAVAVIHTLSRTIDIISSRCVTVRLQQHVDN